MGLAGPPLRLRECRPRIWSAYIDAPDGFKARSGWLDPEQPRPLTAHYAPPELLFSGSRCSVREGRFLSNRCPSTTLTEVSSVNRCRFRGSCSRRREHIRSAGSRVPWAQCVLILKRRQAVLGKRGILAIVSRLQHDLVEPSCVAGEDLLLDDAISVAERRKPVLLLRDVRCKIRANAACPGVPADAVLPSTGSR
jgi:hypothetical protein